MHRWQMAAPGVGLFLASVVAAQAPSRARVVPERIVASVDSTTHLTVGVLDSGATVFPRVVSWAVATGVARADAEWPYREAAPPAMPDDSTASTNPDPSSAEWPYRIDQSGAAAGQLAAGTIARGFGYAAYWHPYHHHYHYYGCGCGCGWVYYRYARWYSPFAARYSLGFVPSWSTAGMAAR